MAVLGRLLISSAERVDLSDLISIDSYAAGDWKYFLKGLVGDSKPYVLKGFDIIDPSSAIGSQSCSIRVAESMVFYPGSSAGSFFHGMPEGHAQASPLIPELRKNATNYVYLTFSTLDTSEDTRAFWDPDKDGGVGGEFTQDVNTESVLKVDVNVSTGSFPANTIPIAKIVVGASTITSIEDARHMLFRLGSGGLSPDPYSKYQWQSSPSIAYKRTEPSTKITSGGVNPFQGADKNIASMKEWMDAVMSKLAELGGTNYWYEDASAYSLISNFIDSNATAFKSKGKWMHDGSTPGLLTWTEDLNIKVTADPRTYIVRSGSVSIEDEQVLCIPMIRNGIFTSTDQEVEWTSGASYVNTIDGVVGLFSHLSKGDYIKKINDSNDKYLRVEEFYDSTNLGGIVVSSTLAKSVRLSSTYLGTSGNEKGRYDQGIYTTSNLLVTDRNDSSLTSMGGNFHWLAMRSDTIQNISSIVPTAMAVSITNHDGVTAKVTTGTATGLADGDRVHINGTNFNGIHKIEVESPYEFYITQVGGPFADESCTASFATVTTTSRSTAYGLQLESANHGFNTDDTITISDTFAYNDSYPIYVASPTVFRIPLTTGSGIEVSGHATLARVSVRTEGSITQVIQGQTVDIGTSPAENMKQYLGMNSLSETGPTYTVPTSYGALNGMADYNSTPNENITSRVAKLTSMMADKAQDRIIKIVPSGYKSVTNTTSGLYQSITFNAVVGGTPRIDIVLPGSDFNSGTLLLNAPISLAVGQAAYISIDRNNAFGPFTIANVNIVNIHDVPIRENVFVIATRLATSEVWLWDNFYTAGDTTTLTHYQSDKIVQQIADQFKMSIHPSNPYRIKVGGADTAFINNSTLTKSIKDLMISFDGAEIDFSTGQVYKADGVTALGVNFTPASIPSNQYFWYSIGLNSAASVNANNTIDLEFIVTPALSSGATYQTAPRATYVGEIRLGQVYVQQGGSYILPITAANLHQLTADSNEAATNVDGTVEFTLANNQVSPANVTDFAVNTTDAKIFKAEYGIARRYHGLNGVSIPMYSAESFFNGGEIHNSTVQLDNKIIVVGTFTGYSGIPLEGTPITGVPVGHIARINTSGYLDMSFNYGGVGADQPIMYIAKQSDGKLIVASNSTTYNSITVPQGIFRLNTDGTLDTSFNAVGMVFNAGFGGSGNVTGIAVSSDDSIIVTSSGYDSYNLSPLSSAYPGTNYHLIKLSSNGIQDLTFNGRSFNDAVLDIKIDSSLPVEHILICGLFTNYTDSISSYSCGMILKLDSTGLFDTVFNNNSGIGFIHSWGWPYYPQPMKMNLQSDGKIIVTGLFSTYNYYNQPGIIRINSNGSFDPTFYVSIYNSGGYPQTLKCPFIQPDGKIIVLGDIFYLNGVAIIKGCVRLNLDGSLDTDFNSPIIGDCNALLESWSNRIIVFGRPYVHLYGEKGDGLYWQNTSESVRLNTDGTLDRTDWRTPGVNNGMVYAIGGSWYSTIVAGSFQNYNRISTNKIIKINHQSRQDLTFIANTKNIGISGSIRAIAEQVDGKILIGGDIYVEGTGTYDQRFGLSRLNSDGSLDLSFNNSGTDLTVGFQRYDIAGAVYVAGIVYTIALDPITGKSIVGGDFDRYTDTTGTHSCSKIARLNIDGTFDNTFGAGLSITYTDPYLPYCAVNSIAFQSSGMIIVGGGNMIVNSSKSNLARITNDGVFDSSFNLGQYGFNTYGARINYVRIQSDNKIVVAGDNNMLYYNGVYIGRSITRLNSDGTLDTVFKNNIGSGANGPGNPQIYSIELEPDGKIILGGDFESIGGIYKPNIVRLNPNGSIDGDFDFYDTIGGSYRGGNIRSIKNFSSNHETLIGGNFIYNKSGHVNQLDRMTNNPSSEYMTQGSFSGIYRPSSSTWTISGQTEIGDVPEVALSITNAGQVQYTSSNLTGTPLESKIKFKITKL